MISTRTGRVSAVAMVLLALLIACAAHPRYLNADIYRNYGADAARCEARARITVPRTLDELRDAAIIQRLFVAVYSDCMAAAGWRRA